MGQIVDNSPEADINSPEFQAFLAGESSEKTDVKPEEKPSSGESKIDVPASEKRVERVETKAQSVDELESQIKGLKAELARKSGQADKVEELENQLQFALGRLEEISTKGASKDDPFTEAVKEAPEKTLILKQVDWEDELADARARLVRAEETGDERAIDKATQRIQAARRSLSIIRTELVERSDRKSQDNINQQNEATKIHNELEAMYTAVEEKFPDFQDPESELWQAGNAEFKAHETLLRKLGPAGEIVAAAMAIIKRGGTEKGAAEVRKQTIRKIDAGLTKALQAGAGSPSTGGNAQAHNVSNAEGLANFNAYIDKIKGG